MYHTSCSIRKSLCAVSRQRVENMEIMTIIYFITNTPLAMVASTAMTQSRLCFVAYSNAYAMKWSFQLMMIYIIMFWGTGLRHWSKSMFVVFLVRRRLRAAGYIEFATDPIQRARNFEILKEEIQTNNKCPCPLPFHNMSFILAGTVPKYGTKKYSQSDVEALIRKHGGKCRKQVPGIMKGRSTKKYVTLCSTQALKGKSVNSTIKKAVRLNYPIVDYRFVFDSADMAIRQDLKKYVHDTSRLQCYISRNQTLGKVHFKREKNLINIIKNRRKSSKVKAAIHSHKVPRNVVLYYVKCKLAECGDKYSFVQYNSFVSKMAKEWVKEPPHGQSKYIDSLHRLQDDKISSLRLRQSLANYNKVVNPVFKTFLGWNCFSVIIL